MPTTYTRAISETALRTYGKLPNLLKTVEELSELQRAISRYIVCQDVTNTDNLQEEIADVEIMLDRLRRIVDPLEIESWKAYKLDRMAEKLGITVTAAHASPVAPVGALSATAPAPRPPRPTLTPTPAAARPCHCEERSDVAIRPHSGPHAPADACALDADPAEPRPGAPVGTRKEAAP